MKDRPIFLVSFHYDSIYLNLNEFIVYDVWTLYICMQIFCVDFIVGISFLGGRVPDYPAI